MTEPERTPPTGEVPTGSPDKSPARTTGTATSPYTVGRPEPSARPDGANLWQLFLRNLWSANTVVVTTMAIVLAMAFGGLLIILSTPDLLERYGYFLDRPGDALGASWYTVRDAYLDLFRGSIFDAGAVQGWINGTNSWELAFFPISETLNYAAPLVFTGLCVALAFRGGLFNIGAQGQAIMGVVFAGLAGFLLHLPPVIHLLVALLAAAVGGLIWGFIPGFLKARTGAHEVITTIMLNYVALLFLGWLVLQEGVRDPDRSDAISRPTDETAELPRLLGDNLRVGAGILVAVLAAWAAAWVLNRSTFGFELRAVGANPDAARTAGMSVGRTITIVMAMAGALAGLGGGSVVLGAQATALTGTVVGNIGFDGILVALLGRVKPWGVVLAALLFGALRAGGNRMQSYSGISLELVTVLQALIVLFVAAPALVKAVFQLRAARSGRPDTPLTKGW
jgi:simple sugar transport system permease protein